MARIQSTALKIQPSSDFGFTKDMNEAQKKLAAHETCVAVVGLGYVGLPLACHLAKSFKVIGFDINVKRVNELKNAEDSTNEIHDPSLLKNKSLTFSLSDSDLEQCQVLIVAVPTPVDSYNRPDLTPLISATKSIAKVLKPGMIVVYESTVYPGVTEDVCQKLLERETGLKANQDFYVGYSPERINPGDLNNTIDKITKVVSGSTPEVGKLLAWLYGKLNGGKIHLAQSIKVAEAAKISENIQRDVNIALINELTVIYGSMGISITEVLEAARTKWNFLNFYPGLVGGHCIGVDPYYLTHVAEKLKTSAFLVSTSRQVNEGMPRYIAQKTVAAVLKAHPITTDMPLTIGILGAAFKENVPDVRNTKVVDLATELEWFGCKVHIVDEHADSECFSEEYKRELQSFESLPACHALIIAVRHDSFVKRFSAVRLKTKLKPPYVIFDLKEIVKPNEAKEIGVDLFKL